MEILDNGLTLADTTALIKLNMAEVFFTMNNFRKAAAFYDESFPRLHKNYEAYFQKKRDLAYQFIKTPPENIAAQDIVAIDVAATKIFGADPERIKHIKIGDSMKIGTMNLDSLKIKKISV